MSKIAAIVPGLLTERARVLVAPNGIPLNLDVNEYGELRVVQRATLLDIKQVDLAPNGDLVTSHISNGGGQSYSRDRSGTVLTTDTSADALAVLQSRQSPNYQAGKRHLAAFTAGAPAPASGAFSEIGVFNATNGLFWRRAGGVADPDSFVVRSDVSGIPVDRIFTRGGGPGVGWFDPLDGTGVSGVRLEPTDAPIFFVAYSWFGVADLIFGFILDNKPILAHYVTNKDQTAPYMRTPNLPIRWQLRNGASGATEGSELLAACASVESEGAPVTGALGLPGSIANDALQSLGAGSFQSLISLRLKANVDRTVIPLAASVSSSAANGTGQLYLLFNPTLDGTLTWSDAGGAVEASTTQLDVETRGRQLTAAPYTQGIRSASAGANSALSLGRDYDGASDIIVLAVRVDGAQSVRTVLEYREVP